MEFAYSRRPGAGVPYIEIAHIPARDQGVLRLRETGASSEPEIPDTVNAADVTCWSDEVDVLVIGFGIAGGSAAVSAAAAGARVLLLETAAAAGGTTRWRVGTSSRWRHRGTAGHRTPRPAEEMYKYLVAVSREPDHEKIRAYCDGSVEHFNWLEDLGFQFERSFYPGKIVVPPGTEGLSYTGNEKVWPFSNRRSPRRAGIPYRCPANWAAPPMVIDLLVKRADELGVLSVTSAG